MSLTATLNELSVPFLTDEPMCRHTSFKTGGNAQYFIMPRGVDQTSKVLAACRELCLNPLFIGNGSNLLVPDSGLRRPVISMTQGFDSIEMLDNSVIRCGAGVSLMKLCVFARDNALSGLEFAYGIPGSVGGAAVMNAGAYGGEMKDVLLSCAHLGLDGEIGTLCGDALCLGYRHSAYSSGDRVITSVTLGLRSGSKTQIQDKMEELMQRRKDKQPLEYPSAGSVFKRPEGYFAGALIEQCGLKGKRVGGACVSEKHAGFIVNTGGATSSDVLELIEICKSTVKIQTGVTLEAEIRLIED